MKTTIDIPDDIYRQVKAKSALEGLAVREVAISLFSCWVNEPHGQPAETNKKNVSKCEPPAPPWFGALRSYAPNALGKYDMAAIRRSIAQRRKKEERP